MSLPRSFRLSPRAAAVLDALPPGTSATEYVEDLLALGPPDYLRALVDRAEAELGTAWGILRAAGWARSELLAACDVLNGWDLVAPSLAEPDAGLALELHDAARLNETHRKWDVSAGRWADLVRAVADDRRVQYALRVLAREFWAGNPTAVKRLESQ